MANTPNNNMKNTSHSVLDFLVRIIGHEKKLPICEKDLHVWVLIEGTGYDYKGDYYLCKKCEHKIPRQGFEL